MNARHQPMPLESKSDLAYSVKPREFSQARARRTYEALLAAAEAEFSARGFDATQTPDVASRAGVSVGTFYRYFADKKEILLEVLKRELLRGREEVLAGLTTDTLLSSSRRDAVDSAIGILFDNCNRDPGLHKVFIEMSLRDEDVARLRGVYEADACESIAALIAAVCRPEEIADPAATAYVILTSVVECACVSAGARGQTPIDARRSRAALSEFVCRAVFGGDAQ